MDYFVNNSLKILRKITGANVDIVEVMDNILEIQVNGICVSSCYKFETDWLRAFLDGMICASQNNL